jgi:hypothetical protein
MGKVTMSIKKNTIWTEIDALATSLDCNRDRAEATLDRLELELLALPSRECNDVRRKMIFIIAQLSRLEVRMMSKSGPRPSTI